MATNVASGALKVVAAIVLAFVGLIVLSEIPFIFQERAFDRAVGQIKPGMTIAEVMAKAPERAGIWISIVPDASPEEQARCRQALASAQAAPSPSGAAWHPKPHTVDAKAQAEYDSAAEQLKFPHYEEAMDALQRAVKIDPLFYDAHKKLDDLYSKRNWYGQAADTWSKLLAADPGDARALCERGGAYSHIHDAEHTALAMADAKRACSIDAKSECCAVVGRPSGAQAASSDCSLGQTEAVHLSLAEGGMATVWTPPSKQTDTRAAIAAQLEPRLKSARDARLRIEETPGMYHHWYYFVRFDKEGRVSAAGNTQADAY